MKTIALRLLIIGLCAFVLSSCAPKPQLWLADSIVSAGEERGGLNSEQVTLKLSNQVIAASINRSVIRELLEIHAKIDEAAQVHSTLYITNRGEPYPNAFAATINDTYIIAVNLNMIEMMGSDQNIYAALMAHEIAHHVKQHKASEALFNHKQEREADELGIQLMHKAGYPLDSALTFYQKLAHSSVNRMFLLKSHPNSEERLKYLKKKIKSLSKRQN